MREAWKPLHAGETDAALVRNQFVPELLEKGFNKLYDFVEDSKPHGRPDRVTVARKSFIERNPELLKRYWKATIRGYHFMRIVPENFPFQRMVESKIRVNNPDPSENMRDLRPMRIMESAFFPLDGQLTVEGVWRILQEHQDAGRAVEVDHAKRCRRRRAAGIGQRGVGRNFSNRGSEAELGAVATGGGKIRLLAELPHVYRIMSPLNSTKPARSCGSTPRR